MNPLIFNLIQVASEESHNNFFGDAHSTDATPLNIFNKKLTTTTVTRQWRQDSHLYQHSA